MSEQTMRRFWDERAEEDPYFFVDNRQRYGVPDLERFWAGGTEVVDKMLEMLGAEVGKNDDILDLGCGVGRMTRSLAERGKSVRAIDISTRMLETAKAENAHLSNVEWILGDGKSLEGIENESIDCVFEFVVFHHIPDPAITLGYVREIGRVLRPGGWAALQISNDPEAHRALGTLARARNAVGRAVGRAPGGQHDPAWRGSAIDLERLGDTAIAANMDLERVVGEGSLHCLVLLRKQR